MRAVKLCANRLTYSQTMVMCCLAGQQPLREELYHAIAAMQARVSAAERRRNLAGKDLTRSKQELERIRGLAKVSRATKQRLADAAQAEADWMTKPGSTGILSMTAGPLSKLVSWAHCILQCTVGFDGI